MRPPRNGPARGGRWRIVLGAVGFSTLAPLWSAAVPLAALLLLTHRHGAQELLATGVAAGIGLWWLLQPGDLPAQFLRAVVVMSSAAFVILSLRTRWSFTHRALAAALLGLLVASLLLPAFGSSWPEITWWVEFRQGIAFRGLLGMLSAISGQLGQSGLSAAELYEFERRLVDTARLMARYAPSIMTLQVLAGLALATAIYRRLAAEPIGRLPARFRDLRFSEHLGWAVVVSLAVVVLPRLAAVKVAAANVLVVAAVLYALRGAAVVAFGLHLLGGGGLLFWMLTGLVVVLMLPIVVGGAILLGILDAGMNLRRRWSEAASR